MRWLFLAVSLVAGCGSSDPEPTAPLCVAAASSLTEVVPALGRALDEPVVARFDASSALARQIESGEPLDVFLSADGAWADHVIASELATASDRVAFATNRIVVVVPAGAERPTSLAELRALAHVAVAAAEVPAGRAARAALAHEGLLEAMSPNLVDAPSVRAALAWVARGEADAALVYATDARVESAVVVAFEVPLAATPAVVDVAVALRGPRHDRALAFVTALRGPAAQRVLAEAGFGPAP